MPELIWNGLRHELHISVPEDTEDTEEAPLPDPTNRHATVDLGQIHQAAVATNDGDALIVSGRGIRSLKRQHSKQLGEIQKKRSRCKKGSRRRVRDLRHKGTRQVVTFCKAHEVESVFVGNPDGCDARTPGVTTTSA